MTRTYLPIATALACVALALPASAELPANSGWYYRLSGAEPLLSRPGSRTQLTVPIRFGADFALGRSCGSFDPMLALKHEFDKLRNLPREAQQVLVSSAQSAIAGLPGLILQRANPGLYELFQNFNKEFQEKIALATKSCEEVQRAIAAGQNPYEEWVQLSVGEDWKLAMGTAGVSVVDEKERIEQRRGENGVPWIGGDKAGGVSQPPAKVIGDVVEAGYGVLSERGAVRDATAPADFTLPDLDGRPFSLAEQRGKWVVVNLWATWCPPCLEELPELDAFHRERRSRDAVVVGLDYETIGLEALRGFLARFELSYPIVPIGMELPAALPKPRGLPTTYLIAPNGELARTHLGPVTAARLELMIRELEAEGAGKPGQPE